MNIKDLIAEVRAHDVSATPGPWDLAWPTCITTGGQHGDTIADGCPEDDAALIAHYRTAAPLLADEVERLTAANEELRLTLAAEQGRVEGAPSEGWRYVYAGEGYEWALPYVDADPRAVEYWARMDRTIRPPAHCDVSRTCGDKWLLRWHHDLNRAPSAYDTARAAMLAAKEGA